MGVPALLVFLTSKYQEYEIRKILQEPALVVGTITEVGRYTKIEYKVDGRTYSFKSRLPEKLIHGRIAGDTLVVIYSRTDPDNAVLKRGFAQYYSN